MGDVEGGRRSPLGAFRWEMLVGLLVGAVILGPLMWIGIPAAMSDEEPATRRLDREETLLDEAGTYIQETGRSLRSHAEPGERPSWRLPEAATGPLLGDAANGLTLADRIVAHEREDAPPDRVPGLNHTSRGLGQASDSLHVTSEAVQAGIMPPDRIAGELEELGDGLYRLGRALHRLSDVGDRGESLQYHARSIQEAVLPAVRASGTIEGARLVEIDGERWINVTVDGDAPMPRPGSGWVVQLCHSHSFTSDGEEVSDSNATSSMTVAARSCADWTSHPDGSDDRVPERVGPRTLLLPVYMAEERDGGALTVEVDIGPIHTRHSCPMPEAPGPMTCTLTEVEDRS